MPGLGLAGGVWRDGFGRIGSGKLEGGATVCHVLACFVCWVRLYLWGTWLCLICL